MRSHHRAVRGKRRLAARHMPRFAILDLSPAARPLSQLENGIPDRPIARSHELSAHYRAVIYFSANSSTPQILIE
jgi:hypothetical protein